MVRGRVYGSEGGVYRIRIETGQELDASLRGRLKREARTGDKVVVGDEVEVLRDPDGSVTIEGVHARKTQVVRKGPGGRRPKVVAANVDRLIIVVAATRPEPRQALIDRLLIIGESNGLDPVLVLNKWDLLGGEGRESGLSGSEGGTPLADPTAGIRGTEPSNLVPVTALEDLYSGLGYRVLRTSVKSGRGLGQLKEELSTGTSALVGPSGVGKSSLLNAIQPGLGLRIGGLSVKQGRGRHTTVSGRLIPLDCGGLVVDTPGFSDVGVWGVEPRELEGCFPEFSPHRESCRFRGCTHLHEPGCGVQVALEKGEIQAGRFEIYRVLHEEARSA